jgi:hypothetical protein
VNAPNQVAKKRRALYNQLSENKLLKREFAAVGGGKILDKENANICDRLFC